MFKAITKPLRPMIVLYAALGIGAALLEASSVLHFQRLVDVLGGGNAGALPLPLALYAAVTLGMLALYYLEEYPDNQLRHGLYQRIRQLALSKVSRIDYTAYQDIGTGQLVQLLETGATAGRDIVFDFYLRIGTQLLPGALFSIALMGVYDPRIMLAALSGYLLVFLITRLLLKRLYAVKEETLVSEEWLTKSYVRAMMELLVFRVNRRFGAEGRQIARTARQVTNAHTRIKMVHEAFFASFALIVLVIKVVLIAVCAGAVFAGTMSVGVLLALLTLIDKVYQPIAIFNVIYVDYKLNRIAWQRFARFMNAPDDPGLTGGAPFALRSGHIRLENVSFAYGDRPILRGITLDIPSGQSIALIGESGGGKSTLVKLILGLIKPQQGRVLVDGQNLADVDLGSYYQHVAYVSQDPPVFDGTLRENLCFDDPTDDATLLALLDKAQLLPLAQSLPQGLDTRVGEHGVKLSGGEKQRLAFARVLHQRPAVVILDEPTSALDTGTEDRVLRSVREHLKGVTVISIAHRMSTVEGVDRVVALVDGTVREV